MQAVGDEIKHCRQLTAISFHRLFFRHTMMLVIQERTTCTAYSGLHQLELRRTQFCRYDISRCYWQSPDLVKLLFMHLSPSPDNSQSVSQHKIVTFHFDTKDLHPSSTALLSFMHSILLLVTGSSSYRSHISSAACLYYAGTDTFSWMLRSADSWSCRRAHQK